MIRVMMYSNKYETWRAACYVAADGQGELCLTGPESAHLDDDALVAAGRQWLASVHGDL